MAITRKRAVTLFHLVRKFRGSNLRSYITMSLPGCPTTLQVVEAVRNDEWCRSLRDSGFVLDPATIHQVSID